jgi:hypothetical protein
VAVVAEGETLAGFEFEVVDRDVARIECRRERAFHARRTRIRVDIVGVNSSHATAEEGTGKKPSGRELTSYG